MPVRFVPAYMFRQQRRFLSLVLGRPCLLTRPVRSTLLVVLDLRLQLPSSLLARHRHFQADDHRRSSSVEDAPPAPTGLFSESGGISRIEPSGCAILQRRSRFGTANSAPPTTSTGRC